MHDPENFPEPEKFDPERFLTNEVFEHNSKVCPFSIGLRNCVGMKVAKTEYFSFAAHIVHNFVISHVEGRVCSKLSTFNSYCVRNP